MIINCPSCDTSYQIDPAVLGARGRKVRCTNCGVRWFVAPPAAPAASPDGAPSAAASPAGSAAATRRDADPPTSSQPPDEAADGEDAGPFAGPAPGSLAPAPEPRSTGALGWLSVTVALVLLTAAVVGRDQIVSAVPGTLPLYQRLGLPVTVASNLVLREVRASRIEEDGTPVLQVVGEIVNVGDAARDLPPLRVSLLDAERREIEFVIADPPVATLPAGGLTRFEARLLDPPAEAQDFKVTLDTTAPDGR